GGLSTPQEGPAGRKGAWNAVRGPPNNFQGSKRGRPASPLMRWIPLAFLLVAGCTGTQAPTVSESPSTWPGPCEGPLDDYVAGLVLVHATIWGLGPHGLENVGPAVNVTIVLHRDSVSGPELDRGRTESRGCIGLHAQGAG